MVPKHHLFLHSHFQQAQIQHDEVQRARRLVLIVTRLPDQGLFFDEGRLCVLVEAHGLYADPQFKRIDLEVLRRDEQGGHSGKLQVLSGQED